MQFRKSLAAAAVVTMGAAALAVGPASADGGVVKPTSEQKSAVIKGWSKANGGGWNGPDSCLFVRLSASNNHIAGLYSNVAKKPNKCAQYAFDGSAILYGHKKKWFLLNEGSSIKQAQCKASEHLMGSGPWADMTDFAAMMGCQNVD